MKDDITKVVHQKLEDAWSEKLITPELHNTVRDTVLSAPLTNFLWASLVVDELAALSREDVIRDRLGNLPPDASAAMMLVLRRLSQRLDDYAIEDLNDLLAWVECSHTFLSLAQLDAMLTLRKPGGARVVNLDELIRNEFAGLFITANDDSLLVWPSEQRVQQRLQDERRPPGDHVSLTEAMTMDGLDGHNELEETVAASHTGKDDTRKVNAFERKMESWRKVSVRLTHPLVKQYIKARAADEILKITTDRMHVKVLIGCLQNLCHPSETQDEKTVNRANSYCAEFIPELLSDVEPEDVQADKRATVVQLLLNLLRNDQTIDR